MHSHFASNRTLKFWNVILPSYLSPNQSRIYFFLSFERHSTTHTISEVPRNWNSIAGRERKTETSLGGDGKTEAKGRESKRDRALTKKWGKMKRGRKDGRRWERTKWLLEKAKIMELAVCVTEKKLSLQTTISPLIHEGRDNLFYLDWHENVEGSFNYVS